MCGIITVMLSKDEFKDIFDIHYEAVRSFVYYRCGDVELASDITQDVFMRIWEKRNTLNSYYIKPLLYKIANDFYISAYRKNQFRMDFEQSMMTDCDSVLTPEDDLTFDELKAAYAKALEQMPDKQRTVFLMNREEGMKYAEIADCLNISVKAVEKNISAALRLLRTKLL